MLRRRNTRKRNYIPVELIEKILLALPVKSIVRFSTVSKLWNSTISRPQFAATYRGREMIVLKLPTSDFRFKTMTCPLSSISSHNPIDEAATDFFYPFEQFPGSYVASCDHLWCVEVENSLVLYNPSMQAHRLMYKNVILSFNLSEEKFEEIELAEHDASLFFVYKCYLDMIVFGGKLRVYRNHKCCFTVWVMEDYESKLWIKEMEIDYTHIPPLCYSYLKPFYFYDSVGNLVRAVTCSNDMEHIFIVEDVCSTLAEKSFSSKGFG